MLNDSFLRDAKRLFIYFSFSIFFKVTNVVLDKNHAMGEKKFRFYIRKLATCEVKEVAKRAEIFN